MKISEIKELMAQFDASSLRQFSYKNAADELSFSKNDSPTVLSQEPVTLAEATTLPLDIESVSDNVLPSELSEGFVKEAEGEIVDSPLVGVAYLSSAPDKPSFVSVGDTVKKGQTLLIIEAMKVMNEVPAPRDGIVTEILVANEEIVEFGKGLVRLK